MLQLEEKQNFKEDRAGRVYGLAVIVTLLFGDQILRTVYEGCHATWERNGAQLAVWVYAEGPGAHVRAEWAARYVVGFELVGDHEAAKAELLAQKKSLEEQRRQAAGPDYPRTPPSGPNPGLFAEHEFLDDAAVVHSARRLLHPGPGEMEGHRKELVHEAVVTTRGFIEKNITVMPLETQPAEVEARKKAILAPKVPTHLMARPDEAPEQNLWIPRGRPTPHRETKPRTSGRKKPSRAFLGLRTLGTALLLGFAALGGTD